MALLRSKLLKKTSDTPHPPSATSDYEPLKWKRKWLNNCVEKNYRKVLSYDLCSSFGETLSKSLLNSCYVRKTTKLKRIWRVHQVYTHICASCHSMGLASYLNLVGVAYTEEETKAMAAEIEVVDGPNYEDTIRKDAATIMDVLPSPDDVLSILVQRDRE